MKKKRSILLKLLISFCMVIQLINVNVYAEDFITIVMTFNNTTYTRQVYDIEANQIKAGVDSPSVQWVKDTCDHVAFITNGATSISSEAVVSYVKTMIAAGNRSISLKLEEYTPQALVLAKQNQPLSSFDVSSGIQAQAVNTTGAAAAALAGSTIAISPAVFGYGNLISSCTTKYTEGQDRSKNIKVAAGRINGLVILPNQLFSYSSTILPRTVENGYGLGGTIVGGQHIKSVGGGICQVSSTLNAAVLKTGIIPIERHNHSERIGYLASGLDATVSGNTLDYKFVNTLGYPIYIQAITTGGRLTVSVYSAEPTFVLYDTVVEGSKSSNSTYVVGYMNGAMVSKVKAYSSKYK